MKFVKIVKLNINHYDLILEVWKICKLPVHSGWRDTRKQIQKQLTSENVVIFGAKIKDKIIGVVVCTDDSRKGWIEHLAVLPEYRRMGIAKILVKKAESYFKKRNIKIVAVLVEGYNNTSLKFFKRIGYKTFRGMKYLTKRTPPELSLC